MKKLNILFAIFLFFPWNILKAQSLYCETAIPLCIGPEFTYPANISGYAQPGAYYACLASQPAPSWFYMLVENPGDIIIYMYSTPLVDIDFICWGPFNDPNNPCVEGLTEYSIVDCSYSNAPSEYCDILDCQAGEYYILMVPNYSLEPNDITFLQTEGSGSMDCILISDFTASPREGPVPLFVHFTEQVVGDPSIYKWDFQNDGIYDNFNPNPTYTYNQPGNYTVKLKVQNPAETDSTIKVNYISVLAPDIESIPSELTIIQSEIPRNIVSDQEILDTLTIYNTGNYVLTINSITVSDPWIMTSGFPDSVFTLDPGAGQQVMVDIDWPQLEGIIQEGSIIVNSSDPDEPVINVPVTAIPLELPDLLIQNQYVDPSNVFPGASIIATCDITNEGNADAPNSELKYFLSPDSIYDSADLELASDSTGIIRSGTSINLRDTLQIPSGTSPGPWHILFFADALEQIEESDEDNNVNYVGFTVDTTTWIDDPGAMAEAHNLKIYPNPARDRLYIDYTGCKDLPLEIAVLTAQGGLMTSKTITRLSQGILSISTQGWPIGFYLLRLNFSGGIVYRKVEVVH